MDAYTFLEEAGKLNTDWLVDQVMAILSEDAEKMVALLRTQWEAGQNEEGKAVGHYKYNTESYYAIISPPKSGLPKITGEPYNLIWDGGLIAGVYFDFEYEGGNILYYLVDSTGDTKEPLFTQIRREALVDDPESIFGFNDKNLSEIYNLANDGIVVNLNEFLNK